MLYIMSSPLADTLSLFYFIFLYTNSLRHRFKSANNAQWVSICFNTAHCLKKHSQSGYSSKNHKFWRPISVPQINLQGSSSCKSLAFWCCKSMHDRYELPQKTLHSISSAELCQGGVILWRVAESFQVGRRWSSNSNA